MKKLFTLAFALVFSTGIAFAQNNESIVNQSGSSIDATVTQTGQDNYSELNQSEDFLDGHSATITQVGDENYSNIQTQNGGGVADVYMEGDRNALVDWATRTKGGFGANQKNSLTSFDLDILGSDNVVGMTQEFGDGTVNITGDGNQVGLRQLSGANYQAPDFHTATIEIGLFGSAGNYNEVDVNQAKENGGTGGVNNGATVKVLRGDNNLVDVQQFGSDNRQTIEVDGDLNKITAEQTGVGNGLYLNARGTGPGSTNIFSGAGGVDDNTFTMTQHGDDNLVDAGFDGVGNEITIMQDGTGNLVDGPMAGRFDSDGLAIIGDGNLVNVMQTGSGHMSTTMINGNNNTAMVTQSN